MYIRQVEEMDAPNVHFRQFFRYHLRAKQYGSKRIVMDMYEDGSITDNDIEMFKFLYEVKVATKEQILKRCPWLEETSFDGKVERWVKDRFMNMFVMVDGEQLDEGVFDTDALKFYTIEFSTVTLLRFFSSDNDLINWNPRALVMPWHLIKKTLLAGDFRIAMETKLARDPITYDNNRMFIFGRFRIVLNGEIFLNIADDEDEMLMKPYVQLSVTQEDFEYGDHTKINESFGRFQDWYEREGWKSYFKQVPGFLIVTDTEETVKDVERLIEDIVNVAAERATIEKNNVPDVPFHDAVQITCKKMFDENLETCFVKYDTEEKKWIQIVESFLAEKS